LDHIFLASKKCVKSVYCTIPKNIMSFMASYSNSEKYTCDCRLRFENWQKKRL